MHADPAPRQSAYYQPSGKVARGALLIGAAYSLAVLPGAWLYAWVTMRAPAFVNVVVLLIFGLWIAVVVDLVALRAKVRSRAWIARYAVALAAVGWYCHWAVWLGLERRQSAGLLALDPAAMFAAAVQVAHHNAWGIATMPMVAVWLLEAYILMQLAPGLGVARAAHPFCEASDSWAETVTVPRKFAWLDQPAAVASLLEEAPQQLASVLAAWPVPAPHYAEATLFRCRGGDAFVTLTNVCTRAKSKRVGCTVVAALRLPGMHLDGLVAKLVARADARSTPPNAEPVIVPELASAHALFQAAQFADALARAVPHTRARQRTLRVAANRLCALACTGHGRWGDAGGYWHAVFDDEPAVAHALHLAGSLVMGGRRDDGHAWFARARALNAATRELPPLSLLTNFVAVLDLAGQPAAAMRWLDEIRDCYCRQRVTDPASLYANRMPPLADFLDSSAPVVLAALGRQPGLRWFAAMLGHLDEGGNVELGQWLDEQERSLAR